MITLTFVLLTSCLVTPAFAVGETQKQLLPTSPFYLLIKVKESVQQFLTFNQDSKVELLENFAQQRVREMEYASFINNNDALDISLNRYQTQKTQVLGQVKGISNTKVVEEIKENTLEQQQTMTKMQLQVETSKDVQQRIVEVQKEVAVEVKKTIEVVQGSEEAAEMDNKIHYVWLDPNADAGGKLPALPDEIKEWEYAPGTEGRDESGRVIEITYAPGTTAGGETGNKIEIQWAPGTEGGTESKVQYEGASRIVIQEDKGKDTDGIKKIEIQQVPGTNGGKDIKIETQQIPGARGNGSKVEIKEEP